MLVLEKTGQPLDLYQSELDCGKLPYSFLAKQFLGAKIGHVFAMKELRQNQDDGSTILVQISIAGTGIEYQTGQNLAVYPENDAALVRNVAEYLKIPLEQMVDARKMPNSEELPFPQPITVAQMLTHFCDIQGPIMKNNLKKLTKIAQKHGNELAAQKLEQLVSEGGRPVFEAEIEKKQKTIFELIQDLKIVPTLAEFIEITNNLAPRLFTIASSNLRFPKAIAIADSLVVDKLENSRTRTGVCSQYIKNLYDRMNKGEKNIPIRIEFRPTIFKLPAQPQTPVIMFAAGTGVAPFIGFCQEKEYLIEKGINKCPGDMTLYFGCRHQIGDFIFKSEISKFAASKILLNLYCAFSRDQDKKVYVQDLMQQHADQLLDQVFGKNGVVYMCGQQSMCKQIIETLRALIVERQKISKEQAEGEIAKLEKENRIIREIF